MNILSMDVFKCLCIVDYICYNRSNTHIYIVCLSCLLVVEEVIYQFKLKLESSMRIYFNRPEEGTRSDPLVLDI